MLIVQAADCMILNLLTTFQQVYQHQFVKDKRKQYGVVDKCLSEQQFCKSDMITFVV